MPENPHPLHLVGVSADAATPVERELQRLREEIEARNRQETAIAELGQAALTGIDPLLLLGQVCALLEATLEVDHARALEIAADGGVRLLSSIGSNATFFHCDLDGEENESLAMYVAVAGGPVTFDDLERETRFKSSHLRAFHNIRCGAAAVIPSASGAFGILVVYSTRSRTFADYEIAFLRSTAALVGEAVERARTEDARRLALAEVERREQRFRALVEKSWSGVALLDRDLAFTYAGASTERLLGYSEQELVGTSFLSYVHPRDREAMRGSLAAVAAGTASESQGELRFRHRGGSWVWLEGFAQDMLHDPSVGAIVLNYRDVTQRKATEKQLEYQAYYDALTGLPNRLLFRDRVINAIAQAQRNRRGVAVMYLDLDHFKLVNDGLGHSVGDALLSEVAARLQGCVRASDTISRLGGDEFTILLMDTSSSEAIAGVARKILDNLARPLRVEGHELFVSASIGVSVYPADGTDVEALLKAADSAMYRAKELGRNQVQMFTAAMNERYSRRLVLEQSLHHALERNELEVYYQPIFDRLRRRIVSLEALIRWNHPSRGLVSPAEFIPLAEETGLIVPIGEWVLRRVCSDLRGWRQAGLPALCVGVNISAPQFQQASFTDVVTSVMGEYGTDATSLQFEITETVAVQNFETTMHVMAELKRIGIRIAIDDFGTGHSSLIYLKRFPIDTVKIDRAFVNDVTTDESAAAIVSYIISLAHTMRLDVVAEGVETDAQWSFLKLNACDQLQGYLFSRPLPHDEAEEFIRLEAAKFRTRETPRP